MIAAIVVGLHFNHLYSFQQAALVLAGTRIALGVDCEEGRALARASQEETPHLLTDVQLAIGEIKLAISQLFDLN